MAIPEPNLNNALFKCQFLLGPSYFHALDWDRTRVFDSFCLSVDPRLVRTTAKSADRELLCLGDIYDPEHPEHDNSHVLEKLIGSISEFSDFEKAVRSAGGRWLIFLRIGNEARVYPDPTGSMPVYYCEFDGLWLGSTPQIIAEALRLKKDEKLIAELSSHRQINSWPGEVTPYKEILHMVPNHFFDLARREPCRFWPLADIPRIDLETAITGILKLLYQITLAASNRYELYMAITGGYDSRATLAGVRGLFDKIKFFTVAYPNIKRIDLEIPRKIARRLKLDYRIIPYIEPSQEFLDLFDRNAAAMVSGQCRLNAMTYQQFADNVLFLEGSASPIGKAAYYKRSPHPEIVTPEILCKYAHFSGNPVALRAFDKWLQGVPLNTNVKTLDLLYWEQRMGSWNAMDFTSQGITRQVMSPFNCRAILEMMLGVPAQDRQYPHRLHRKMCDRMLPEARSIGFNTSWAEDANKFFNRVHRKIFRLIGQSPR